MRLLTIALLGGVLLFGGGCVKNNSGGAGGRAGGGGTPAADVLGVTLLLSDLGLGDGAYAREAQAALVELDKAGRIRLHNAGGQTQALQAEAGGDDVGLPVPDGSGPGQMTLNEAAALLEEMPPCDLLVISSGYLLPRVLQRAAAGALNAKAILLLDEQGMGELPQHLPLPVFRIRYDIRHMAFAAGVAAGASAASAHFGILYAGDDPQGEQFAAAAAAGAKYQNNGAWCESIAVPVDSSSGTVQPEDFQRGFRELQAQGGPNWKPNHFILALGRSTPAIANALSKKPTNAYIIAAYADYRQVRPARLVGCALKRPGPALAALFARLDPALAAADPAAALAAVTDGSVFTAGLVEDAVGFTGFDLYNRYNMDGDDIRKEVERVVGAIRAGELNLDY